MLLEAVLIGVVLFNGFWGYKYLREFFFFITELIKRWKKSLRLQCPDAKDSGLESQNDDRLYGVVAGGKSKHYLGKQYDVDELKSLSDEERANLYKLYEAKLSSEMIDSMGSSLINLYSRALGGTLKTIDLMGYKFRIDDEDKLARDLEKDPVISLVLGKTLCETYYKFGSSLGPIMMGLITMKHVRLEQDEQYYQDDLINGRAAEPSRIRGASDGTPSGDEERKAPE